MAFDKIKKFIGDDENSVEQVSVDNDEYYNKETFKQTNNNGSKMILL